MTITKIDDTNTSGSYLHLFTEPVMTPEIAAEFSKKHDVLANEVGGRLMLPMGKFREWIFAANQGGQRLIQELNNWLTDAKQQVDQRNSEAARQHAAMLKGLSATLEVPLASQLLQATYGQQNVAEVWDEPNQYS